MGWGGIGVGWGGVMGGVRMNRWDTMEWGGVGSGLGSSMVERRCVCWCGLGEALVGVWVGIRQLGQGGVG